MTEYFFELGRESELSRAEIIAALNRRRLSYSILPSSGATYLLISSNEFSPNGLMDELGGTLAIGTAITHETHDAESILDHLTLHNPGGKIIFSLHGEGHLELAKAIKKLGKEQGRSLRYIEPNNTATILHNGLLERQSDIRNIAGTLFATQAIQPIVEFSRRDFGRPGRDDRSGMLPPKLSKMLVNLSELPKTATILDPFCGSGTLLMEAALMGYTELIGTDISDRAIADTKKNFDWLRKEYTGIALPRLSVSDVRSLPSSIPEASVAGIITEPFLGTPRHGNESEATLQREIATLTTLLNDAFHSFARVLEPGGIVVCIVPCFRFQGTWLRLNIKTILANHNLRLVPFAEHEHLLYARPQQFVGREIWRFKKSVSS